MPLTVVVERLLMATLLAGCVGFERERHGRAAGLRTHMLVGIGACLFMLTDLYLWDTLGDHVHDPTRIAAQVVSGIGFLGAGTILRFRASIRGLTTAASLWAVAGLGLASGCGFGSAAIVATVIMLVVLFGMSRLERAIRKDWYRTLVIETPASGDELAQIRRVLANYHAEIRDLEIGQSAEHGASVVELDLRLPSERDEDAVLRDVLRLDGTRKAHWA